MKKLLYYFLIFPICLSAQINESDTLKVKASVSITGFYQGGNVETLIFRTKTDFTSNKSRDSLYALIEEFQKIYGLNYTILRYGSLYGPRADSNNGMLKIISKAVNDKKLSYEGHIDTIRELRN